MFSSKSTTVFLISALCTGAQAQERLDLSPGLTADRLVARDPAGRVQFYVERTITGRLVIRDTGGSVVGNISENSYRRNSTGESRRQRLSLPEHWKKDR